MPDEITTNQVKALLEKIENTNQSLTDTDRKKIANFLKSSGAAIAVLDEQVEELAWTLSGYETMEYANRQARASVLNALRGLSPPAANVNIDAAMQDAKKLREEIKRANNVTKTAIAGIKFAVNIAGKLV